jgi:signal transduction histidine kinase
MTDLSGRARQAAVLEERNRIAREIHDTLAQGLTGVIVNLEASSRALKRQEPALAAEHIEHARELAQDGLAEARNSVRALRPNTPHPTCLVSQLEYLVRMLKESGGVQARFAVVGQKRPVPEAQLTEILRIAQESSTNVLRHAKAESMLIRLSFEESCIGLTISDDGVGFVPNPAHEGFGLVGMQERAQRIGGQLAIHSVPGTGTRISLSVRYADPV